MATAVLLRGIVGVQQEAEIRRPELFVGIEAEVPEVGGGGLPDRLQIRLRRLAIDLDELPEVADGVQRHGIAVEGVPLAVLLDDGRRREAERAEDLVQPIGVVDPRLHLAAGLRGRLDQRTLVRDPGRGAVVGLLASDPERLVGLGEIPVGSVVVGVDLSDAPDALGAERRQSLPDRLVGRPHLQLDFVHTAPVGSGAEKARCRR